jgi:PAS domain S-box-containing protein
MLRLRLPDAETSGASRRRTVRPRVHNHPSRTYHPTTPSLPEAGAGLFELFRDAVVAADLDTGRIVLWNPAAETLCGYSAAEAIGMDIEALMPPAVAHVHRQRVAHFARTGEAAVLNGRAPLGVPVLTRSGAEIRVEMSLAPMEPMSKALAHDPVRHILLMFRDASLDLRAEVPALEATRAESARAETEAKLHMSQDLVPDSVGELDAALARARTAAGRLARLAKLEASARPQRVALMARVVELRTEQVRHTMQQIIDAAACQTASFELDTERVNLVPLIGRTVAAARTRSAAHQIRLSAPQGLTALADGQRLARVVHDLILMAVRRNPRGCWIDVDLRRPLAGLARIEVRDYGRQLSPREHDRLPDSPLVDRSWFVIKHIVAQHHGNLSVESLPEGGLRVTITLPTHRPSRAWPARRGRHSRRTPEPAEPAEPPESAEHCRCPPPNAQCPFANAARPPSFCSA